MTLSILIGGVAVGSIVFFFVVLWLASEVERKIGRDMTIPEALAFGFCMPYSALLLLLIEDRSRANEREKTG